MKCPKCKFITFDYFDTCPRCGKDMTGEKTKLNIFSIKPNPPFFLGSLIGDFSDRAFGMESQEQIQTEAESKEMEPLEVYDDGRDLEITIDENTVSAPSQEHKLTGDSLDMSSYDKSREIEFPSDTQRANIQEELGQTRDASQGVNVEEGQGNNSMHKKGPEQDMYEPELESGDLDLKIDLDDMKILDMNESLEQNTSVTTDETDSDSPATYKDREDDNTHKKRSEKDTDKQELASEDVELNIEIDDGERKN